MSELDFGYKVAHRLNQADLPRDTAKKLFAARTRALAHHRAASSLLSLPGIGHLAMDVIFPRARVAAALLVLVIGVGGISVWNSMQKAAELEAVDSALLSDDLPINAYLDNGFDAWLKDSSQATAATHG